MRSVLVLGDSLSFHGPRTPHPADDTRLWPHGAAAGPARHAGNAVRTDPRVWASVMHADVLVLGVGGMDSLPSPLPTAVRELIPVLRPAWARARAREGYRARHAAAATAGARWAGGGAAGPAPAPAGGGPGGGRAGGGGAAAGPP